MNANNMQISTHRGPFFEAWCDSYRRAFGVPRGLDEAPARK